MKNKAFTTVEILIFIVIVAVLAALLIPAVSIARKKAQEQREKENIRLESHHKLLELGNGQKAIRLKDDEVENWLASQGVKIEVICAIPYTIINPARNTFITRIEYTIIYRELKISQFSP